MKEAKKKASTKHPGGRPLKYNKEVHPLLAEAYAEAGYTDKQIADKLKISESTIYKWKLDFPEFSEALKSGKVEPDQKVEDSLYKRANGFEYTEVKLEELGNDNKRVTKTRKLVAPDTTAAIFWLKNRRPDRWRDRQDVTLDGSLSLKGYDMSRLTKEELEMLEAIGKKAVQNESS